MIYLDTSVLLAQLLAEDRQPKQTLWRQSLVSSRLLEYEVWNRIHARRLKDSHGDAVRKLLQRVALIELVPPVLVRALEPFPLPVRTLDALHLGTLLFLVSQGQSVELMTYDERQSAVAKKLGLKLAMY